MDPVVIGIIGVIALLVMLFLGMNIGFSMIVVGFVGYACVVNVKAAMGLFASIPFSTVANYSLSVIPMFVLMGQFCFYSGLSQDLYAFCHKWIGRVSGGLASATIVACAFFAAICGSSTATTATMGVVCLPEMRKYKYKDTLACGSIAAGGTLGILIPPSVGFILYAITAEQSIGTMFAAGIIPGILLAAVYVMTIMILVKKDPSLAPKGEKVPLKEKVRAIKGIIGILILFVIVLGGIFSGLFTANEGSAIGAFGALIFMIVKKKATWENIKKSVFDTLRTSCMIFMIMIGAYVFGYFLTVSQLPIALANGIAASNLPNIIVILLILAIYAVLGCFVDSLPLIVLLTPIFLPIVNQMGLNTVWFGVLMVMIMQLGLITPPVGMCVYVMGGIAKDVPLMQIFKGVFPFVIALIVTVIIVALVQPLTLWLPTALYG
jgi:tripartite ATP-independent transporter DctM subunit